MDRKNIQKSKNNDPKALMENIRKNPPKFRSINEIVSILHVISAEQRSCSILRSCVDKVLMNMSDIRTLRDIIERLRSVSRTNGLRFELPSSSGPETRCNLISDMFNVEILLGTSNTHDQSPTVVDVRIQHHRDEYRSCPHLVNIIRAGKFLELSNHLKGLTDMYLTTANRQTRTRVYMALQSLEADLVKMSHVYRETHKDASNLDVVMKGTVGLLTPRIAGERPHLTYYLSPYDLLDTPAKFKVSSSETVPKNIGLHAKVGIEQRSATCSLPISPLIFNKHSIDNSGIPRFMDVSQHNTMTMQACFVLYLTPAVPVLSQVAEQIQKDTNLVLVSNGKGYTSYLELLNADKDTYKIEIEKQRHTYHLNIDELRGTLVDKVYFTHPGHVVKILNSLRQQAHLNTLLSSCIRSSAADKGCYNGPMRYFDISVSEDIDRVNITMENPLCNGTAFLEVKLDQDGLNGCKIYTGRGDPPLCTDQFVKNVLQKCASIPLTMKKLIEQSIKHPRKESEVVRVRPPALFGATSHPVPARAPNLLTPVQRTPLVQRLPSTTSTTTFTNTMATSYPYTPSPAIVSVADAGKKVSSNPMLAKLLIPATVTSSASGTEPAVQTKNHPMLMGLLKESESQPDHAPLPHMTPPRSGKNQTMQMGYPPPQPQNMMGNNHQPPFNPSHEGAMMGLMSPNSTFPSMDQPIPVPASHQMPPPSYPSHHPQNQFGSQGSLPGLVSQQSPVHTPQQFQIPHSPYSSQRSPIHNMDDITGPVTPTYPMGMLSPGLISPGLPQNHTMPAPTRGRRGSRQKSRSIESQQSVGGMDFSFDVRTPTAFESQMSVESDTSSISDLVAMQNRSGMTPLRRTDSMSPGVSAGMHMPLQQSTSLKGMGDFMGSNNVVTRSSSVGGGGKGVRSMTSPGPRNLKTPTLPNFDSMMGSPPLIEGSINQRLSRGKSFEGHPGEFFRPSLSSTSPSVQPTSMNPLIGGSIHESDTDPFTFDDNKNPSKISMPESTSGGPAPTSRTNKLFQGGRQMSQSSLVSNTGASDTLRELAKSKPTLLRELTGSDSPSIKPESSTLQRLIGNSTAGITANFTSGISTQSGTSVVSTFDVMSRFTTTTVSTVNADKNLVRQNAVDKQSVSAGQSKSIDGKAEKTVKRRNSNKGEDNKPGAKKRGRPPSIKDHGGKRKKSDMPSQEDGAPGKSSITLNIQLSSTGAPISSTTKTKPIVGAMGPLKNPPPTTGNATPPTTSNSTPATTTAGSVGVDIQKYGGSLEKYFKNQEELRTKRKAQKELKDKKAISSSPTNTSASGKSSSSKYPIVTHSSNAGGTNSVDKTQMSAPSVKPGSAPRVNVAGGSAAKRNRKNSIKDVIEKLQSSLAGTATTNTLSSPPSNSSTLVKQGAEKDANGNLVNKTKSNVLASPHYPKLTNSNPSKANFSKFMGDDKFLSKAGITSKPKNLLAKSGIDLSTTGKSVSQSAGRGGVSEMREFEASVMRKESGRVNQPDQQMKDVIQQIQQAAAATAAKGSPHLNKIPAKVPRVPPTKARSVTPTPSAGANTPLRKSPSQQIRALSSEVLVRQLPMKQLTNSNNVASPPVKKSPSRSQTSLGGIPSRSNSTSVSESAPSLPKPLPSTVNQLGLSRKPQPTNSTVGDHQTFIAPSISPTPKRTTSPQIGRTTSPLTRNEEKILKGIPNRSPHRPSPSNSRMATPVPAGSPQSPDDRLVIDDPTMPAAHNAGSATLVAALSRDEQRPVFIPGNRANERQSPERTVMPSPLSPPGASAKSAANLPIGIRRASTPRSSLVQSPSLMSVSSASVTDSPCNIDDDLMDQAVTG